MHSHAQNVTNLAHNDQIRRPDGECFHKSVREVFRDKRSINQTEDYLVYWI